MKTCRQLVGDPEGRDYCGEPAKVFDEQNDEWVCEAHTSAVLDAERRKFLREWDREVRERPDPDTCPKCSRLRWECRCWEPAAADDLRKGEREN